LRVRRAFQGNGSLQDWEEEYKMNMEYLLPETAQKNDRGLSQGHGNQLESIPMGQLWGALHTKKVKYSSEVGTMKTLVSMCMRHTNTWREEGPRLQRMERECQ
jgi:hypothetical protein